MSVAGLAAPLVPDLAAASPREGANRNLVVEAADSAVVARPGRRAAAGLAATAAEAVVEDAALRAEDRVSEYKQSRIIPLPGRCGIFIFQS